MVPPLDFEEPHLRNEDAAYEYVEARIWRSGRTCPHCGIIGDSGLLKGRSTRIGVYKCYACRKPFTVKIGTIFEASHVPVHMWLQAIVLMCGSKKGISTNQLRRILGVTLPTAWHMSHRIRLAMDESGSGPLGGEGQIVESDETYTVHKEGGPTSISTKIWLAETAVRSRSRPGRYLGRAWWPRALPKGRQRDCRDFARRRLRYCGRKKPPYD